MALSWASNLSRYVLRGGDNNAIILLWQKYFIFKRVLKYLNRKDLFFYFREWGEVIVSERTKRVGERIKAMRMQRCMSQSEVAKMIGISQAHLSNIECGRSNITLENLFALQDCFEVRMAAFFEDLDSSFLQSQANKETIVNLEDIINALQLIKKM